MIQDVIGPKFVCSLKQVGGNVVEMGRSLRVREITDCGTQEKLQGKHRPASTPKVRDLKMGWFSRAEENSIMSLLF